MSCSDPGLRVLHAMRLTGFADAATMAERLDRPVAEIERELAAAELDGLVRHRDRPRSGWSLTAEGRQEHERLLAAELDRVGARVEVEDAYRRFVPLNRTLLEVCTAWQVVDRATGRLNAHDDLAYDEAVIGQLAELDRAAQPLLDDLGRTVGRFGGYRPRLARALARIGAGDGDWFTRPTIDSYHTVWFELHEDLLATLGLDRSTETIAFTPATT